MGIIAEASAAAPGFCLCGCGNQTDIATRTRAEVGWVKGEPKRFVHGHHRRIPARWTIQDRGYETACWIWQLRLTPDGYGIWKKGHTTRPAHCVLYEDRVGPIPDGLQLDHLCRNRACVNPAHLEAVTGAENVRRGASAKLTPELVEAIRSSPESGRKIARQLGIHENTVYRVRRGESWMSLAL